MLFRSYKYCIVSTVASITDAQNKKTQVWILLDRVNIVTVERTLREATGSIMIKF